MMPLTRGSLYSYNYLWSREFEKAEISGRKARPVCLVVRSQKTPAALFLFPLTSKTPAPQTLALEVPADERHRANLQVRSWIVIDEYNRCEDGEFHDFESLEPIGAFSFRFLKRIASAVSAASKARRLKAVPRS